MKRLLAILALLCLLTGCAEENAYIPTGGGFQDGSSPTSQNVTQATGEVRLAYDKDGSLYPYTASDRNNRALLSLIYQGLFAINADYEPTPILCRSYKVSSDMRTWTFYLEDATFSDGQALTAADVAVMVT